MSPVALAPHRMVLEETWVRVMKFLATIQELEGTKYRDTETDTVRTCYRPSFLGFDKEFVDDLVKAAGQTGDKA